MKAVISIKNFSKTFGSEKAVSDLSFEVNQGDIFAFLGSNGSGKTTTIRCLLDIYQADQGELLVYDKPYSNALASEIGYLPEERGLYTKAKVDNVLNYFAALRGLSSNDSKILVSEYLEKVGLKEHQQKNISQLSSGMQQKVQLGTALIHKPKLLILDEPFKGLDPLNRALFQEMFQELQKQGTTILYSTHVLDEAQRLANRLVITNRGERKAYGEINEVRRAFGNKIIHLEFNGKLPKNDALYSSKVINQIAEITPGENIHYQEVLKFLISKDLDIINYRLDYPSLSEIFVKISQL
ncbi:MAG: ATP-binding cassette domain-containing protein [bacterium]